MPNCTTPDNWNYGCGTAILSTDTSGDGSKLEPSGMTAVTIGSTDYFYLVSDNGMIARAKTSAPTKWALQDYGVADDTDFESVTATGSKLMVGVEGGKKTTPQAQIKRFDPGLATNDLPLGDFTGSVWNLTDLPVGGGDGMEAMTFVPNGYYPTSYLPSVRIEGVEITIPPYYGGLFFAACQADNGLIYVYNLEKGNGTSHDATSVATFSTGVDMKISDLYFLNGNLYVLYDDTTDALQTMSWNGTEYTNVESITPPYVGCEALTVYGDDLYIGLDQNSSQMSTNGLGYNYVFQFSNFL